MISIITLLLEPILSYLGFTFIYIYNNYDLIYRCIERAEIVLNSYEWEYGND